jgi:RNA polymerase sigma factor (TIGR02999 family)
LNGGHNRVEERKALAEEPVTDWLLAWGRGDESALASLMPLVHRELHRLARRHMRGEGRAHTLQPTALVNEAYLRLVRASNVRWQDRAHFFAIAARLMRQILVDHARRRNYVKRGGDAARVSLDEATFASVEPGKDLVALDEALRSLAAIDERKSRVIELRFFGGLSVAETAAVLNVSSDTVLRDWRLAKAWLTQALDKDPSVRVRT